MPGSIALRAFLCTSIGLAAMALPSCDAPQADAAPETEVAETVDYSYLPIPPLPRTVKLDVRKVELGRELFHDPRLSKNNTVSCASCHVISAGGDDGRRVSIGIDGQLGTVNSPTVLNSAFNFRQFWDGRAATLEDQVDGPLHSTIEMGSSFQEVIAKLAKDPDFERRFRVVYPKGLTPPNLRDAIATFERSLVTPDSPFDRYLRGDASALSQAAKRGYELFQELSCVSCHQLPVPRYQRAIPDVSQSANHSKASLTGMPLCV